MFLFNAIYSTVLTHLRRTRIIFRERSVPNAVEKFRGPNAKFSRSPKAPLISKLFWTFGNYSAILYSRKTDQSRLDSVLENFAWEVLHPSRCFPSFPWDPYYRSPSQPCLPHSKHWCTETFLLCEVHTHFELSKHFQSVPRIVSIFKRMLDEHSHDMLYAFNE